MFSRQLARMDPRGEGTDISIDGTWFAAEVPLTFLFQHKDGVVSGVFHDEKTFTCELRGTLAGNRLTFNFETAWSWLNVHDMGSATLDISADGSTLSGPVLTGGKPGKWTLTRTMPAARPPPPAPPPPAPPPATWMRLPFPIPPPHGQAGGGGNPGPFNSYHDRINKDVVDAQDDPALLARLRVRAGSGVEPELHDLMLRRHLIDK